MQSLLRFDAPPTLMLGWTMAPSLVSTVALTSSSSQFTASFFVLLVDQRFEEGEEVARIELAAPTSRAAPAQLV